MLDPVVIGWPSLWVVTRIPLLMISFENDPPSSLTVEMSQAAHDSFCNNESHEFLKLMQLLTTLKYIYHVANVNKLLLIIEVLLCGSTLDNSLHHLGKIKDPRKLILIWDTGASYRLMMFSDGNQPISYYINCPMFGFQSLLPTV